MKILHWKIKPRLSVMSDGVEAMLEQSDVVIELVLSLGGACLQALISLRSKPGLH